MVLQIFVDGLPYGSPSGSQRSFPRPHWPSVALQGPSFQLGTSELTIKLLDADPLQPRLGAPFCFGLVRLKAELAPLAHQQQLSFQQPLEAAPGHYGALSFRVCRSPPAPGLARPEPGEANLSDLAHPLDWCGVLRFSPELRDVPRGHRGVWSMEAAAGPPDSRDLLSPSSGFVSWQVQEGEDAGKRHWSPQQLFVVERDLVVSLHASCAETGWQGSCVQRLSKMRGPRGPCNLFMDPHPPPVVLKMHGTEASVAMHLRFFPADFLRPSSRSSGISIRITLAAAPPALQLPVAFGVPSGCFSMLGDNANDTSFHLTGLGDCVEICLPDPARLVGRSVWKVTETGGGNKAVSVSGVEGLHPPQCLLDILAMRLRPGHDKVFTLPLGDHAIALRFCLTLLHIDVPRPVLGVSVPAKDPMEELSTAAPSHGEVVGIFVHALAVHSPQVTCCLLNGGPEAPTLVYPLPHFGGRIFVPAQPDGRGKLTITAFLPEFGCHAVAQTAVADSCLQLHWRFSDGPGRSLSLKCCQFHECLPWFSSHEWLKPEKPFGCT